MSPPPARKFGHVVAVSGDQLLMVGELVAYRLLGVSTAVGRELKAPG
jgi:hypothetical protein